MANGDIPPNPPPPPATPPSPVDGLFADPDFLKKPQANQSNILGKVLSKHDADFAKLPPDRQQNVVSKILTKRAGQTGEQPSFIQRGLQALHERLDKGFTQSIPAPRRDPAEAQQAGARWLPQENRYESSEEQYSRETASASAMTPSQMLGQYTQEKTQPYIGGLPSRLVGATVAGATNPLTFVGGPAAIPGLAARGGVAGLVGQGTEETSMAVAPNHPGVARTLGFAAPLALDVATPSFSGAGQIGEAGTTASEEAAARTTAENVKATEAAKTATAKQLEQYSTDVSTSTQKTAKAQQAIADQRAKAEAEMPQKMAELRTKAENELAKQAQQEAFGRELGEGRRPTDPEIIQREGQPPTSLPGQEEVARQAAFRNPILDSINRATRELRIKRDAILARRGRPAPTELQTPVAGETAVPEDPQALMARLRGEGGPTRVVQGGGAPRPTNMPITAPPPPEPPIMTSRGAVYRSPTPEEVMAPKPKPSGVYKMTPEGRAVPVEPPAPPAAPVRPGVIDERDFPPEMQGQVHEFQNGIGDPRLSALVTDEGLSKNTMKYIMDNQQVGIQLANGLDDAGKIQLRQGIADYYQNMGGSLDASHAPILKAAGFGKALSNPESWAYAERAQDHFATTIENAPAAKRIFEQRMTDHFERLQAENDAALVKEGLKWADKLPGGTGGRIRASIEAAQTMDAKAQVVSDAYQHLQAEAPPIPPELGRGLAQGAPQGPELADPNAAARTAGVKAVQEAAAGRAPESRIVGYAKRRTIFQTIWTVMRGGGTAAGGVAAGMGHPLPLIAIGGGLGIKGILTSTWRNAIARDPVEAERLFQAYQNPGRSGNLNYISARATEQLVNQAAIQIGRQPPPGPDAVIKMPPGTTKGGPGPMSKAIEQKQAYQMASETRRIDPAHVQQVASLHKDISTGGMPNVQHDLSSGRLSQGEVRKMVEPTQPNASQMFQGMQLADAMEAFGRGTDEEKAMALPLLAQKLNDEGKNLSPLQRRQMMAQLRQALPQEEAVG